MKLKQAGTLILLGVFLIKGIAFGQSWPPPSVRVTGIDQTEAETLQKRLKRSRNLLSAREYLANWLTRQHKNGHAEAAIDYDRLDSTGWQLELWKGPVYRYHALELTGLAESFRQKARLDRLAPTQSLVDWDDLSERLKAVVNLYQQQGYPFARFYGREVSYQREEDQVWVDVSYLFETGPLSIIDTLLLPENLREKPAFVYNLIGLRPGDPYKHQALVDVPRLLNNSIYYNRAAPPEISFNPNGHAIVKLDMAPSRAGRFNLLLGILPPREATQRLQFTGSVDVLLVSPLRLGEILLLKFDQLPGTSQRTEVKLRLPYILRTPVRAEGSFFLQRQEDAFLTLRYEGALTYAVSAQLDARFFLDNRNSRLLDSALLDTENLDPDQLDGGRSMGGIGFSYLATDAPFNPSKGIEASLDLGLGRRFIRPNIRLDSSIYENRNLRQNALEARLQFKSYLPLAPRQVLFLGQHTYWLGMTDYLRNDQLQVGGAKSLRGFNENAFFTDLFSQISVEYRFQLEQESYLFGFYDLAYLRDQVSETELFPMGAGIGMNYSTRAGILSVIYAVGRTSEIPLRPAQGRIHVGILNRF